MSGHCVCGHAAADHLRGRGCCLGTTAPDPGTAQPALDGCDCDCGVFCAAPDPGVDPDEGLHVQITAPGGHATVRLRATPDASPALRAALAVIAEVAHRGIGAGRTPGAVTLYRCGGCGARAVSGVVPPAPALGVFGLPKGWTLRSAVPGVEPEAEDAALCGACVARAALRRARAIVKRFVVAQGPHLSTSWADALIDECGLRIDGAGCVVLPPEDG